MCSYECCVGKSAGIVQSADDRMNANYLQYQIGRLSVSADKGPSIKYVHTEGGRGVCPKADIVREVAWI